LRSVMLKKVERDATALIDGNDLAIEYGARGE
jgi:hypothetical protein